MPGCLGETDGPAANPSLTAPCDTDAVIQEELALRYRNMQYVSMHTRNRHGHALGNIVFSSASSCLGDMSIFERL